MAQKVHPDVTYELLFLQAEPPVPGGWQLPGEAWNGRLEGCHKLFLLADEPPAALAPALSTALKQTVRAGCMVGGLSAGVYPLAQLGLLDGYRAAVHWRWQDDFAERFPKVIATSHLFDWDRDRMTACGGLSVLDLLLAVLARDHGAELAGAVSEGTGSGAYSRRWRAPAHSPAESPGLQPPEADPGGIVDGGQHRRAVDHRRDRPACVCIPASAGTHLQAVPQSRAKPVLP